MKRPSETVLKAFLGGCPPAEQEALTRFLPRDQQIRLSQLSPLGPFELKESSLLDRVHWSWFLPTLRTYSETEQKLFLSALSPTSTKNLARALTLSLNTVEITNIAKQYLIEILISSLGKDNQLLPPEYLPASPLNPLIDLSKKELTRLIDFLSLHDLAAELRQIVETKILKKTYSLLTEEERQFLKNAMGHKEQFILSRIGLDRWDGSEETLRTQLHKRGLARLAAALSGGDSNLIWYVCHRLDIGRGASLLKQCRQEPIAGISDAIIKQAVELL